MGNRAKRKEVAGLLREHGLGKKLYRGRKRTAWGMLRSGDLDVMLRKLRFKPGAVVNACDVLNHRVVKWRTHESKMEDYWRGQGQVTRIGSFESEDGFALCGCPYSPDPALPREEIERWLAEVDSGADPYFFDLVKIQEALGRGEHVCDEDGILLPTYYRRR